MKAEAPAVQVPRSSISPFNPLRWRHDRRLREFLGYGFASALALAVDYGLLLLLTERGGLHYSQSAPISFLAGMAVVYLLSVRYVFRDRRFSLRSVELTGFFAIGLAGLLLNQVLLVGITTATPLTYQFAKIPTAGLVFLFNFTARRALLFSGRG